MPRRLMPSRAVLAGLLVLWVMSLSVYYANLHLALESIPPHATLERQAEAQTQVERAEMEAAAEAQREQEEAEKWAHYQNENPLDEETPPAAEADTDMSPPREDGQGEEDEEETQAPHRLDKTSDETLPVVSWQSATQIPSERPERVGGSGDGDRGDSADKAPDAQEQDAGDGAEGSQSEAALLEFISALHPGTELSPAAPLDVDEGDLSSAVGEPEPDGEDGAAEEAEHGGPLAGAAHQAEVGGEVGAEEEYDHSREDETGEGRAEPGAKPPPSSCRCERGEAVDCRLETAKGEPHFKNLAIVAVCDMVDDITTRRQHLQRQREAERAAEVARTQAAVIESNHSDVDSGTNMSLTHHPPKAEHLSMQEYVDADPQMKLLELQAAVKVVQKIKDMIRPRYAWDMQWENQVYTLQNHERLREKKDPFKPNDPILPDVATLHHASINRCAIVGNSGLLHVHRFGADIDNHDAVMRLNQAPVDGYEINVGHKTTHRLVNKKWAHNFGRKHPELLAADHQSWAEGNNYTLYISRANVLEMRRVHQYAQNITHNGIVYPVKPLFLATRVVSHARNLVETLRHGLQYALRKRYRGGNAASTGFLGLFKMLQHCSAITLYGFSLDECRSKGCVYPYHYFYNYVDSEWLRAHPSHSFSLEGLFIQALHEMGEVCHTLSQRKLKLAPNETGSEYKCVMEDNETEQNMTADIVANALSVGEADVSYKDIILREMKRPSAAENLISKARAMVEQHRQVTTTVHTLRVPAAEGYVPMNIPLLEGGGS